MKEVHDYRGYDDRIVERLYIYGCIQLSSPCLIGSGEKHYTDMDVIKDSQGNPFVPGTTLTGILRNYVNEKERFEKEDIIVSQLFGDSISQEIDDDSHNVMSSIYVSDATITGKVKVSVRDGVELKLEKISEDQFKYNYQVIQPGATFPLRLEVVLRKKHDSITIKNMLYKMLDGLSNEDISIGRKRKKGFGKLKLEHQSLKILSLNYEDSEKKNITLNKWLNFKWEEFEGNIKDYHELKSDGYMYNRRYTTIEADFAIKNSIMIRTYSLDIDDIDYEHITSNGHPIISGTTWGGVIRSQTKILLHHLKIYDKFLNTIFGYVDKNTKEANASLISIEESIIKDAKFLHQTRVKIDRFTGGVVESALSNAKPVYLGQVKLKINIVKNNLGIEDVIIGLLLIVIKDIGNGILPIGGETAIGRGILEGTSDTFITIDESPCTAEVEKKYFKALTSFIAKGGQ